MDRRLFLRASLVGAAGGIAGCLATGGDDDIEHVRFSRGESRDSHTMATVETRCTGNRVTIRGQLVVGSSECERAQLESVALRSGVLHIAVTQEDSGSLFGRVFGGGCTDDLREDRYTAHVFLNELPDAVVVEHDPKFAPLKRWERQIRCLP